MTTTYSPTGSQPPAVNLVMRQGPQPGQSFSLAGPTITIGREASNDLVINDSQVSRRHATLNWDGRQFVIQDLDSANGTFVNGVRLMAARALQSGDVIGLGSSITFDFQAAPVAVGEAVTLKSARPPLPVPTPPAAPPPGYPAPQPAKKRGKILIPILALLALAFLLAAAALIYFLWPREETRPLVLINSPRQGEQVEVGQELTVHSIARDEGKVTRVELWVDGQLQESQASALPGGTSPFPLLVRWRPSSPGPHTLIARAFNAQGRHGQASVNVEATAEADRDDDGVLDEADACPDEAGWEETDGCPDSDGDGIPNEADTCPDEAGLSEAGGCPVPGEQDQDGDGVLDEADACPEEVGSSLTEGCPDTDEDGLRNSEDACPEEAGLPEHDGCPPPGDRDGDGVVDADDDCPDEAGSSEQSGCPAPGDRDGDGLVDADDDCPDEAGLSEHAGCPDSDGDGVRDRDDACPDEPGLPGLGGCPDSDGDGVRDRDDACPHEPGPAPGGCPGPGPGGGGDDDDGDGIPNNVDECPDEPGPAPSGCPIPELGGLGDLEPWPPGGLFDLGDDVIILHPVEFEALEFTVNQDYDEVWCYASLAGGDVERHSFEPLDERQWDIAGQLGGINSRVVPVAEGQPLQVQVECGASNIYLWETEESPGGGLPEAGAWGTIWDLGSFTALHNREDWNGDVLTSPPITGGDEGHSFQVKYRLCADSCEAVAFAPPLLQLTEVGPPGGGDPWLRALTWRWEGDESMINGFRLYVNGSYYRAFRPDQRSWELPSHLQDPACGERLEFQMTTFEGPTPVPNRESPRSNSLVLEGPPCLRRILVTFSQLQTHNFPADPDSSLCWPNQAGPIYGRFGVNDSSFELNTVYGQRRACTRGVDCNTVTGQCLNPNSSYSMANLIENCVDSRNGLSRRRQDQLACPYIPSIIVELGPDDDVSIWAEIRDADGDGASDTIFHGQLPRRAADLIPGEYTIGDSRFLVDLTVRVEELPSNSGP
ncbi:MAG: FHA domain-containing protein [Anaerolineae bacterium]|nr:FHA domain-containing protein [Anaerolineae bacterium]